MHPNYMHRRVWRVFSQANPGLGLPADTGRFAEDYPFSVEVRLRRPDGRTLLTAQDLMWLQRDHFEGTPYSTAQVKWGWRINNDGEMEIEW